MMKTKTTSLFIFISLCLTTHFSMAQELDIPRASPKASVSQMIGVCNVALTYGRPAARGRKIIGGLVPYDKVWRAGANEATVLSFDHDMSFGGKTISKGMYGLFMIPKKDKWTIILNRVYNQWGAYNYDSNHDVLRIEVTPQSIPHTERCTYSFVEVDKSSATLQMDWENTRILVQLKTDTHIQTLQEIDSKVGEASQYWYVFSAAAQYHYYERKELDKALNYIDKAIALDAPNPAPWMLKSQILAQQQKYKEAILLAEKAIEICKKQGFEFEIHENEEQIKKWKKH